MSKPVIFLLNKITERGRIDELLFPVGFLIFLVFTLLFNATYINLIEDINRATPSSKISLGRGSPFKVFVVFYRHAKLFPENRSLRKRFLLFSALEIASILAFVAILNDWF
ncbi:MAG: hypothetical protein CVV45_01480 [Spirochaetae bacterium HGW-Spirochaetae-10]|nr:MAG: hypothetical protein CVV45_01480 [Spirochaetae bacterium HGW-Spirochaetae-10]